MRGAALGRSVLALAVVVVLVAASVGVVSAVRCHIPAGKYVKNSDVSWWAGHKIYSSAEQDVQEFIWTSSLHKDGQYEMDVTDESPLGYTLNELKKPAADVRWVKWNDQPPASGGPSFMSNVGHTKGVLASSDGGRGFWLFHSWPQFADTGSSGYGSSQSRGKAVSQHFLCISLNLEGETPEKIANHFSLIRPQIYELQPKDLATQTADAAWAIILGINRKQSKIVNFMNKDLLALIPDATIAKEGTAALKPATITKPNGVACGGGPSCLARRKAKTAANNSGAGTFGAGYVQLFAASETNQPGSFWSAFKKWIFPSQKWIIQTWMQVGNSKIDETIFWNPKSGPLSFTLKQYACFPNSKTNPKPSCLDRSQLHSKVAVSSSPSFPVTCFGDVNVEQTRSAGGACIWNTNVRTLYADHIYNLPTHTTSGTTSGAPSIAMARVDACVSTTAASCKYVTFVESIAEASAYALKNLVDTSKLLPSPTTKPAPKADNDPDHNGQPCDMKPNPCESASLPFPFTDAGSSSSSSSSRPNLRTSATGEVSTSAPQPGSTSTTGTNTGIVPPNLKRGHLQYDWMTEHGWKSKKKTPQPKPPKPVKPPTVRARAAAAPAAPVHPVLRTAAPMPVRVEANVAGDGLVEAEEVPSLAEARFQAQLSDN